MPKRKVVQTVIVYRDGQRIKPTIGEIFDFQQKELDQIMAINPDAVTRPVVEVDVENLEAQKAANEKADAAAQKAANEKADAAAQKAANEKADAAAAGKDESKTTTKKGAKPSDDEV